MIDEDERVVLVNEDDLELGNAPKLDVHRSGILHRAFSVFVLDTAGRILLQRRAAGKYHSPGLWSNTCCGHPRPGELTPIGARRRLNEEMGIDCELAEVSSFIYQAQLAGGLVEHELDHVLVGMTSMTPEPDETEVGEWRWISAEDLQAWLAAEPAAFTAWFPMALGLLVRHLG